MTNESLRDILDKAWEDKTLKDIADASPAVLQGVSEKDAQSLKNAFNINTVRDMGTNKYFLWAQAITHLVEFEPKS